MIKLSISESSEAFRNEFRKWLKSHRPPKSDSSLASFVVTGRKWQEELASGGWVGVHWPSAYGGRGLTLVEEAIIQEELVSVSSPQLLGLFGLTMVGPVLIAHGSAQQKKRFLSPILNAKEIWCQGFSEPGAGSDLAALKCRAQLTEEGFIVNGQKIWTSFAHIADFCFLLCRTSDEEMPHRGLSYLLIDMKSKGITTRPLRQLSGDDEFNEVFFDNVHVPRDMVVGAVGDGWKIAISTLMYERVVLTFARQLQSEVTLRNLVSQYGQSVSAEYKVALAREIARAAATRALAYQHLLNYSKGATPGPEGSLDKLLWSESFQSISKLALQLRGRAAALGERAEEVASDVHRYLYSRGRTIAAGTSEIQRNIIAERILELPRLKFDRS